VVGNLTDWLCVYAFRMCLWLEF